MVPCSCLPLATRSAGSSMPWSQLLRTRWVSGSVIFSTKPLSSSVASPWVTSSTFLPSLLARSRSMRGKRLKTVDIGINRIDTPAVLRQHGLGDDEFAHQVDELVNFLDRDADGGGLKAASRAIGLGCRRRLGGCRGRLRCGCSR